MGYLRWRLLKRFDHGIRDFVRARHKYRSRNKKIKYVVERNLSEKPDDECVLAAVLGETRILGAFYRFGQYGFLVPQHQQLS